jgi:hypothetical protein
VSVTDIRDAPSLRIARQQQRSGPGLLLRLRRVVAGPRPDRVVDRRLVASPDDDVPDLVAPPLRLVVRNVR